jgi:hypothetical protein
MYVKGREQRLHADALTGASDAIYPQAQQHGTAGVTPDAFPRQAIQDG